MNQIEKDFYFIGKNFSDDMMAILEDFWTITKLKSSELEQTFEIIKSNSKKQSFTKREFDLFEKESKKNMQFRIAMFNYLSTVFERHINKLVAQSVVHFPNIKKNYIHLFLEFDKKQSAYGKSIRDSEYELMDKNDRIKVMLNYLTEVTYSMPPLHNWEFLFDISEKKMWGNKNLKFDFTEIRSRRNLLTHRGLHYDIEYIDKLTEIKKSKRAEPDERIQFYIKNKFFSFKQLTCESKFSLDLLTNYPVKEDIKRPLPVTISTPYFLHAFETLNYIFLLLWHNSINDHRFVNLHCYALMEKLKEFNSPTIGRVAKNFIVNCLKNYPNEKQEFISYYLKTNYLLIDRELSAFIKKNGGTFIPHENHEEFLVDISNNPDPIYKIVLAILSNDFDKAIELIKDQDIPNKEEFPKDLFLFKDLIGNIKFESLYRS